MSHSTPPTLFVERQGFLRAWWWLVLLLAAIIVGAGSFSSPGKITPSSWLVPLLLVGLFAWLRLDTRVSADGISYRMRPLGWQHLTWQQVQRAYLRQYAPIAEYGGWGIRGVFTKNRAFNVSGTQGLQLELADGRRILLGTQQPVAIQQVLAALHQA